MSTQVLLDLPDETFRRATHLAQITSRHVNDVLADTLSLSLSPFDELSDHTTAVSALTDKEVKTLTQLQMAADENTCLSELLEHQQAGFLDDIERVELARLMRIYQEGLLRKAQALAEAVRRGLHPALSP